MTYAPRPRRGHVDFAWIGLRVIDELRNRLGGERWICQHGLGLLRDARNRGDIVDEIEIELLAERGVDCVRRADEKSGGARTTASVAILVPVPGRFSMTNGWPIRSDSHCPISRATMS